MVLAFVGFGAATVAAAVFVDVATFVGEALVEAALVVEEAIADEVCGEEVPVGVPAPGWLVVGVAWPQPARTARDMAMTDAAAIVFMARGYTCRRDKRNHPG